MREFESNTSIDREQVLDTLRAHAPELREMGVRSISLFGSVAREEASLGSDIDLLLDVERPFSFFDLSDVKHQLERWLGRSVDVVTRGGLDERWREAVLREAIVAT